MSDKTSDMRLKNCPFCGGEAEFATKDENWIWCKKCGAESNYFEQTEEAIKAWNTRKPLEQIEQRLKTEEMEIEDAIQSLYIEMYRNKDALEKVRKLREKTIFCID